MLFPFADRGAIDGRAQARQDNQYRERIFAVRRAERNCRYAAAKGALVQTTKTMAIELAPHNIQVNAILPGWIETDMTVGVQSGPMFEEIIMRTPAGRFGKPEEMAGAAVFLASHASDFVTGSIVYVDGGYAIR